MSREARQVALAGAVVLAAVPVAHVLAQTVGLDVDAVDAGVFATIVGLVAGAPLALLLARALNAEADRARRDQREADRRELLTTIRTDLLETLVELVERDRSEAVGRFLRHDLLGVLATRLELVDDPKLLAAIARAYHFAESTANLERQLWDAAHSPQRWAKGDGSSSIVRIMLSNRTRELDPDTKSALDFAITSLSVALGMPSHPNMPLREPSPDVDEADEWH